MLTEAGICVAEVRQQLLDGVHHLHRVRAGLALDGEHDGARVVEPTAILSFCTLSMTRPSSSSRTGEPLR